MVTFQPKITFCQKKVWAFGKPLFVFSVFGFAIPVRARESRPSVMKTNLKTLWSCVERYREKIGRKKYRTDNFLQFENTGHGDLIYNIFSPIPRIHSTYTYLKMTWLVIFLHLYVLEMKANTIYSFLFQFMLVG